MLKFFRIPFATSGDRTAVPDPADVNGLVSYEQGYGFDYQRQKTDPASKNIERDKMNEIFFDMTTAVAELQSQGVPDFITTALNGGSAYSYGQWAVVRYSGELYLSLVAANTALPSDVTKWVKWTPATPTNDATFADSSARPASTSWVRGAMEAIATAAGFSKALTANGFIKFPSWLGGVCIQWGTAGHTSQGQTILWPTPFPNACFAVSLTDGTAVAADIHAISYAGITVNGFDCYAAIGATPSPAGEIRFIAIGW